MSALGSAVINKSGKKFAPKAPTRRAPASASTQTSARPSVDRQIPSQTSRSQSLQQHVASSPTPSVPQSNAASTHQSATAVLAKTSSRDEATPIPVPSRNTTAPKHASPVSVVPQKRPSSPLRHPRLLTPVSQPVVDPSHTPGPSDPVPTSDETVLKQIGSHEHPIPSSAGLPSGSFAEITSADISLPAAKRQRVESSSERNQTEQSCASSINANVPIPSTEMNEIITEQSEYVPAPAVSNSSIKAKKPRLSHQEKCKNQIADAAADMVVDTIRIPSARMKEPRKTTKGKGTQRDQSVTARTPAQTTHDLPCRIEEDVVPAKARRKYTRRRTLQSIEDAAAQVVEDAVQGSSKRKRGRKKEYTLTPEDAETLQITPSEVRMMDLCRDGGTGRRSEREKELEELERAEFVRKKQEQLKEIMSEAEPEKQTTPLESAEVRQERLPQQREQEERVVHNVPNTIIVNGQIQIDESSLEIDRHAAAAVERNAEQLDAVDETDMTRKINSATWLKRDKSGGWNEMLTERFYDGLRMFGTDFEMISKMFPGRTRHKIKLKFCKEEKFNGDRIKATLLGEKLAVDLPELEKMAGTEFDDPEELEKDLEEDRIRLQEETAAEKQAMDEAKRERQEQIAAEQAAAEDDSSAKENRRGKGKKKGPKRKKGEKGKKGERSSSGKESKQIQRATSASRGNALGELAEALGVEA